ncbi:MAG: cupin domain-containing protein [Methylophaga sp.]|nr:cupin domain-containing protein [Methylophaga sp.]
MADFFNTGLGLTQQQFLDQYWQKKPLLIRQAFADFESPITPNELAGLACEPEIESRLIEENGVKGKWQVTTGPLSEADFERLPATHWTMLVQDVDKHLPDLQYLLDPFRFIPDWRRDDLMISYAPKHGTVGPHTDGYDVFLLQAMGSRRWQIGNKPITEAKLIDGLDLQILTEFTPDQTWDLKPGDMLYLPPHFAHHGVALNDCMTFSFGFRAPSQIDMLDAITNSLIENELTSSRYQDAGLQTCQNSSEIDAEAVKRLKQLLHDAIDEAAPILTSALGKFVTETKSTLTALASETISDLTTIDEVNTLFEQDNILQRSHYHRFAWAKSETEIHFFMAGEVFKARLSSCNNIIILAEQAILTQDDWQLLKNDTEFTTILCQLIAEGAWFWINNGS